MLALVIGYTLNISSAAPAYLFFEFGSPLFAGGFHQCGLSHGTIVHHTCNIVSTVAVLLLDAWIEEENSYIATTRSSVVCLEVAFIIRHNLGAMSRL